MRRSTETKHRPWYPLNEWEIRAFVSCAIYMGIHPLGDTTLYWNPNQEKAATHPLTNVLSLIRYQQLRRYFHISDPRSAEGLRVESIEEEEDGMPQENVQSVWWHKIEPLVSEFRNNCKRYWRPSTCVAVDEMMIRFFGRSHHTFKMPGKPIKEGYKLWGLCDSGYLYYFMFASQADGTGELKLQQGLTPTISMVYQIIQQISRISSSLTLFLDNLFTSIPLFSQLRNQGIGAVGTTRLGTAGEDFPAVLHILKESYGKVRFYIYLIFKL